MSNGKRQISYWTISAERNWQTAQTLYRTKRYDACLFFCHLTIEKLLKGLVVLETGQPAPYIHDLLLLADRLKISLSKEQRKVLAEITTFNISSRYDNEKLSFYKKCTTLFTKKYFTISKEFVVWLKGKYPKE